MKKARTGRWRLWAMTVAGLVLLTGSGVGVANAADSTPNGSATTEVAPAPGGSSAPGPTPAAAEPVIAPKASVDTRQGAFCGDDYVITLDNTGSTVPVTFQFTSKARYGSYQRSETVEVAAGATGAIRENFYTNSGPTQRTQNVDVVVRASGSELLNEYLSCGEFDPQPRATVTIDQQTIGNATVLLDNSQTVSVPADFMVEYRVNFTLSGQTRTEIFKLGRQEQKTLSYTGLAPGTKITVTTETAVFGELANGTIPDGTPPTAEPTTSPTATAEPTNTSTPDHTTAPNTTATPPGQAGNAGEGAGPNQPGNNRGLNLQTAANSGSDATQTVLLAGMGLAGLVLLGLGSFGLLRRVRGH